jgi:hypothetical protein
MNSNHPWQAVGLGSAPFQFDRLERASGECAVCGHTLKKLFWCRSADSKKFEVGSECIKKIEPNDGALCRAVDAAIKDLERRETDTRVERVLALIKDNPRFAREKHPLYASRTIGAWARFAIAHGGLSKRKQVCSLIEQRWKDRQTKLPKPRACGQ